MAISALCALSAPWAGALAAADAAQPSAGSPAVGPSERDPNPLGSFEVEPAALSPGPLAKKAAGKGDRRPAVTFAGFHLFDNGGSRIFVNLTKAVTVDVRRNKRKVEYVLRGARVAIRHGDLPTEYFTSPVVSARIAAEGPDAVMRVLLREPVEPKHRVVRHADGMATLYVDFPRPARSGAAL